MRLPKTLTENSFDINFCVFILCQLYVLLDFNYPLVVSGVLTLMSLFICAIGIINIIKLKREEPDREIFFDISKNLFLTTVLCVTWLILYDAYATFGLNPAHVF